MELLLRVRRLLIPLAFPALAIAQGGPPLLTDDPGTPGVGQYEINTAITASYRDDEKIFAAPLLDMNFGWTDRGQLKLELPLTFKHEDGESRQSGLGEVLAGLKWRFVDQDDAPVSIAVYPQFAFSPSAHATRTGLAEHGVELLLPVEIARDFGEFSVGAELGYTARTQSPESSLAGLVVGWQMTDRTEWLAEYHQIFSNDREERQRLFNVGLRQRLVKGIALIAALGTQPSAWGHARDPFNAYVGLQFTP